MNDDQLHDKTEDFLRKHLDDFSENPPELIWDKIERRLPPQPARRPWLLLLIGLLLLGLIGEFWYFESRMNRIINQQSPVEQSLNPLQPTEAQPAIVTPPVANRPTPAENNAGAAPGRGTFVLPAKDFSTPVQAGKIGGASRPAPVFASPVLQHTDLNNRAGHPASSGIRPLPGSVPEAGNIVQSGIASPETTPAVQKEKNRQTQSSASPLAFLLPSLPASVQRTSSLPAALSLRAPVSKLPRSARWSVALTAMPFSIRSSATVRRDRISGPDHPRRHISDDTPTAASGWRAGALATIDLNRNLSLVSGALLRQTSVVSTHRPRLEFQDGHHHNGGNPGPHPPPPDDDYEFDYTIYGGGGESGVTVRVSADSSNPSPLTPEHPVRLSLQTEQRTRQLEIPLGIQYQVSIGRLQPVLRIGAMGSWRLDDQVKVNKFEIESPGFRVTNNAPPDIKPCKSCLFALSGWASGGLGYALSTRLSVRTELWYTWQKQASGPGKAVSMQETTLGLSAGLAYRF